MSRDGPGNATSITLRSPWGVDGRANPRDPTDGLVTVTASQFPQAICAADWGTLSS